MIRLAWRQFRAQGVVALAALVVVAVITAVTGPHLVDLYDATIATCAARGDCAAVTTSFLRTNNSLRIWLGLLVVVGPAIIGIFWGAPLVATEFEAGTYRLAWTQSVTRTRWLAVKLGVAGLASMAVAGLASLMVTWWASPLDRAGTDVYGSFDERGVVPIGYAAFAFALGVGAGVLIRRVLPAMALTLVAFVTVRLAFSHWIRPNLITPVHKDLALDPATAGYGYSGIFFFDTGSSTLDARPPSIPNAWITSNQVVDNAGHGITNGYLAGACPGLGKGGGPVGGGPSTREVPAAEQQILHDCVAKVGATYHQAVTYQPGSRYWAFQWSELAIFLGAALIIGGICLWSIRRRAS